MAWDVISRTTDSVNRSEAIPRPKVQEAETQGKAGKTENEKKQRKGKSLKSF